MTDVVHGLQVYLLKNITGSCLLDFLHHKIQHLINRQLKSLVEGSLQISVEQIHKAAEAHKEKVRTCS